MGILTVLSPQMAYVCPSLGTRKVLPIVQDQRYLALRHSAVVLSLW